MGCVGSSSALIRSGETVRIGTGDTRILGLDIRDDWIAGAALIVVGKFDTLTDKILLAALAGFRVLGGGEP